ncbi:helix-turn-helix domain-containing protein [Spirosoma sp.]|uniref:AraC family transcriptional regulator n=1 Tax=Spirosoma sp. TaxID=1899569 RepID=UPI00261C2BF4|nr:helix-turn-helix domain-containing protein [Spirosoma sp.]MCX6218408.1 helix-turn-helix domain-containing protein [Spirosoma sp.]
MKAHLLQVATTPNRSFSVRKEPIPNINNRWHCHKEVELVHFHRGSGTQFVGDSIRRFAAGDVVLIGANLPHYWHYDEEENESCKDKSARLPYATVVHFTENFWGDSFLGLPENKSLKMVLDRARRGLFLTGPIGQRLAQRMEALCHLEGTLRLMALMECLLIASEADERNYLSSLGFRYESSEVENERINAIYAYTLSHFHDKIKLQEVAAISGLVPNSFCRYFKSRTGKSYSQFLLEIRVGNACKLLINEKMSVKQVCYESGFNNFTCFYKKFKLITGKSPLMYQRAHSISRPQRELADVVN